MNKSVVYVPRSKWAKRAWELAVRDTERRMAEVNKPHIWWTADPPIWHCASPGFLWRKPLSLMGADRQRMPRGRGFTIELAWQAYLLARSRLGWDIIR